MVYVVYVYTHIDWWCSVRCGGGGAESRHGLVAFLEPPLVGSRPRVEAVCYKDRYVSLDMYLYICYTLLLQLSIYTTIYLSLLYVLSPVKHPSCNGARNTKAVSYSLWHGPCSAQRWAPRSPVSPLPLPPCTFKLLVFLVKRWCPHYTEVFKACITMVSVKPH